MDKKAEGTIAVYDLGGGTFDVSVLELGEAPSRSSPLRAIRTWAVMIDQK